MAQRTEQPPPLTPDKAPEIIQGIRALGMSVEDHIAAFRQSAAAMRSSFRSRQARQKWTAEADRCDALCDAMEAILAQEKESAAAQLLLPLEVA